MAASTMGLILRSKRVLGSAVVLVLIAGGVYGGIALYQALNPPKKSYLHPFVDSAARSFSQRPAASPPTVVQVPPPTPSPDAVAPPVSPEADAAAKAAKAAQAQQELPRQKAEEERLAREQAVQARLRQWQQQVAQITHSFVAQSARLFSYRTTFESRYDDNTNKIAKLSWSVKKSLRAKHQALRELREKTIAEHQDTLDGIKSAFAQMADNPESDLRPVDNQLKQLAADVEGTRQAVAEVLDEFDRDIANAPKPAGLVNIR